MKFIKRYSPLFLILLIAACSTDPKEINYGNDMCHFCKMTVVDKQHAAELVTHKGKVYVYDAIECMMRHLHKNDPTQYKHFLITDYSTPAVLIDAKTATYLISENLPSPMGGNLTGFGTKENAQTTQQEVGGAILNWENLKKEYKH